MSKITVPCKPDTIIFKFYIHLDNRIYADWGTKDDYLYFKKVKPFSLRYYSGIGILSVKIYSVPKFLYGYSQWEEMESLLPLFINEVTDFLYNNFEITLNEDDIRNAEITELHMNKDFYFTKEVYANRFIEWVSLFEFKRNKDIYQYYSDNQKKMTGEKKRNKSWNITVYDKKLKCQIDKVPYLLFNNSVACVRIEIQLKKSKLQRLPIKVLIGTPTIGKVFKNQRSIEKFWEYYAEHKLLMYPEILSKSQMKKFGYNLNIRKTEKGKQQIVEYLMCVGSKGLKFANSKYSIYTHIINTFKHHQICPVYMPLYTLKDLIKTNNGPRNITDIIEP